MQSSLYVALSAQVALQNRLDSIAQNVANGTTAGYRANETKFDSVLSDMSDPQVAFVTSGRTVIRRSSGELVKTGNPLDVAVKGQGWLSVATPTGQAYTRDGRMRMNPTGELVSLNGNSILDAGGSPIQLDPNAGHPEIGADGSITQGGTRAGVLGLYMLDGGAQLSRVEGGVTSSIPGTPVVDSIANGVVQGFVEQSNVNPITEMTRLIYVQRAFDGVSATMQSAETSMKNAIQTLGSST
jgi:flagellar basal-body rod protein FlgF